MQKKSCIVGVDFGTTSLSAVVVNMQDRKVEEVFNYTTDAYLSFPDPGRKEQSIATLTGLFTQLLNEMDALPLVRVVGYTFTGQMHGIIGLNRTGEAVTNLVTWQDKSGDILLPSGKKLLDEIKERTGVQTIANGYGIVTLYKWIQIENRKDIHSFCTVPDYFSRMLAGERGKVTMSPTMAHSIGLFDIHTNSWEKDITDRLGLNSVLFPEIGEDPFIVGTGRRGENEFTVIGSVGDNQASFTGSVKEIDKSVLLNVGTGTQLSFLISKTELPVFQKYIDGMDTQIRPFNRESYLIATSFLNGGSVYKSLFNFFKETGLQLFGLQEVDEAALWQRMMEVGSKGSSSQTSLIVSPLLEGQRKDNRIKGSISQISTTNFYPGDLVYGFLKGLATYYKSGFFPELKERISCICGAGNGIKRNPLFAKIIEEEFEYSLYSTSYNEEAAVGAVLNAIKLIDSL